MLREVTNKKGVQPCSVTTLASDKSNRYHRAEHKPLRPQSVWSIPRINTDLQLSALLSVNYPRRMTERETQLQNGREIGDPGIERDSFIRVVKYQRGSHIIFRYTHYLPAHFMGLSFIETVIWHVNILHSIIRNVHNQEFISCNRKIKDIDKLFWPMGQGHVWREI